MASEMSGDFGASIVWSEQDDGSCFPSKLQIMEGNRIATYQWDVLSDISYFGEASPLWNVRRRTVSELLTEFGFPLDVERYGLDEHDISMSP